MTYNVAITNTNNGIVKSLKDGDYYFTVPVWPYNENIHYDCFKMEIDTAETLKVETLPHADISLGDTIDEIKKIEVNNKLVTNFKAIVLHI
jgi:hypothetical protein